MAHLAVTAPGAATLLLWASIASARLSDALVARESLSGPLTAGLTLPLAVLLPWMAGRLLLFVSRLLFDLPRGQLDGVENFVVSWLSGLVGLTLAAVFVVGIAGAPALAFAGVLLALVTIHGVGAASRAERQPLSSIPGETVRLAKDSWPAVLALAVAAVPMFFVKQGQEYPLQTGWGLLNYNYHILRFREWGEIGLVPGLHTPVQPALLGSAGLLTGADVFGLLWAVPFLQYAVFALGTFLFVRRATGSSLVALAATWVALWVLALQIFRHLHAANLRGAMLAMAPWVFLLLHGRLAGVSFRVPDLARVLLLPAAAIAAVGVIRWTVPSTAQPWLLVALAGATAGGVAALPQEERDRAALLAFVGGALTFVHLFEGPLFFGTGVAFALLCGWSPQARMRHALLVAAFTLTSLFVLLQSAGWLVFDDPSTFSRLLLGSGRADAIQIPFEAKLELLERGLPYIALGLLGWAALRTTLRRDAVQGAALGTIALAMLLYFMPESGLHRALGPAIPLVGLAVAFELAWFAGTVARLAGRRHAPVLGTVLAIVALIAMTPTLTYSLRAQLGLDSRLGFPVPSDRTFSSITAGEYDAASWIADNTPDDWLVISDPTTMFFVQGLTLRPQVAEERAWVAESEYSVEQQGRLRQLAPLVFRAETEEDALAAIDELTGSRSGAMLIISYRTLDWLAHDDAFRLVRPQEQVPLWPGYVDGFCSRDDVDPCPSRFLRSERFAVIYHWGSVAVVVPMEQLDAAQGGPLEGPS